MLEMERPPNAICSSIVLLRGRWSSRLYQIQAMTGKTADEKGVDTEKTQSKDTQ